MLFSLLGSLLELRAGNQSFATPIAIRSHGHGWIVLFTIPPFTVVAQAVPAQVNNLALLDKIVHPSGT
jgi:hypothetical protein